MIPLTCTTHGCCNVTGPSLSVTRPFNRPLISCMPIRLPPSTRASMMTMIRKQGNTWPMSCRNSILLPANKGPHPHSQSPHPYIWYGGQRQTGSVEGGIRGSELAWAMDGHKWATVMIPTLYNDEGGRDRRQAGKGAGRRQDKQC